MTHKKLNAFLLIDPDDFLDELVTNLGLINDVADAQDNLQGNPVFPHFIKPYSRHKSLDAILAPVQDAACNPEGNPLNRFQIISISDGQRDGNRSFRLWLLIIGND